MAKRALKINWGKSPIFLISYHIILLITLPIYLYYGTLHTSTIVCSIALLWLTGLSITAGYHRKFAHRTYKASPIVDAFLLFFGTMAIQASVLRWAYDHRIHHAFVDTEKDPHSINEGFLYAHCLWMLEKPRPIEPKVVADLMNNKAIVFQHQYYPYLMVLCNAIAFFTVGYFCQDYWGAFFLACWTRIFFLHHFTWFINSLAHTWGKREFSQEQTAVDNYLISLLTFGEGYHNYHHAFANDYRNGIRWFHFDPTKWLIWSLSKVGLAYDLKRMDNTTIKKRMVIEHKDFLINRLSNYFSDKKSELEAEVLELSERLVKTITEFSQLKAQYLESKKNKIEPTLKQSLQQQIDEMTKSLQSDWNEWKNLSNNILRSDQKTSQG